MSVNSEQKLGCNLTVGVTERKDLSGNSTEKLTVRWNWSGNRMLLELGDRPFQQGFFWEWLSMFLVFFTTGHS